MPESISSSRLPFYQAQCQHGVSQVRLASEAEKLAAGDNQVVEHFDADQAAGLDQAAGEA